MVMQNHLYSLVETASQKFPRAIAFYEKGQEYTFSEFEEMCKRKVQWLSEKGVREGDFIALWLVNSVEWLSWYFSLSRLGCTVVPINTRYGKKEIEDMFCKSSPKALLMQKKFRTKSFLKLLSSVDCSALESIEFIYCVGLDPSDSGELNGMVFLSDDSLSECYGESKVPCYLPVPNGSLTSILFSTSGTTSGPKLVMQSQSNLVTHANNCARFYGLDKQGMTLLAVLPFCGAFGLNAVLAAFSGGASTVIIDALDGKEAALLMKKLKVTHLFGSDDMYKKIIDSCDEEKPFPDARFFGFGAFNSSFHEYAINAWSRGIPLFGLYGSSEVMAIFSAQDDSMTLEERIKGGGKPTAGDSAKIRIRDLATSNILPAGEPGEIEIQSPTNFIGYLNNDEATRNALTEDGFFKTGDLGYIREDGSLVYESRMGDAIRLGGFLVNPSEIEAVIKKVPDVLDVCVVAIQHQGVNVAIAFVKESQESEDLENQVIDACKLSLAPFKVPKYVFKVSEFPATSGPNGLKIQRGSLRNMAESAIGN